MIIPRLEIAVSFDPHNCFASSSPQVILVEGPVAAGKTKFAQELAKELDMHYVPHVNMDQYYINAYGFDLRTFDDRLPEGARSFDEKKFLANPSHRMTCWLQHELYSLK